MDEANQIPPMQTQKKSSVGAIIGIVIIIIVLAIGGLYFWGAELNNDANPLENQEIQPLSASDTVQDISADLSATLIGDIDTELGAIETELDAALAE